jgi:hypothetical protein
MKNYKNGTAFGLKIKEMPEEPGEVG